MDDNMTIQEKLFNELQDRMRKRHTIKIFITQSERQGMSSISMMKGKMFSKLLKKINPKKDEGGWCKWLR